MADILITTGVDTASFRRGLGVMESQSRDASRRITSTLSAIGAGSMRNLLRGGALGFGAAVVGQASMKGLRELAAVSDEARVEVERLDGTWRLFWQNAGRVVQPAIKTIGDALLGSGFTGEQAEMLGTLDRDFARVVAGRSAKIAEREEAQRQSEREAEKRQEEERARRQEQAVAREQLAAMSAELDSEAIMELGGRQAAIEQAKMRYDDEIRRIQSVRSGVHPDDRLSRLQALLALSKRAEDAAAARYDREQAEGPRQQAEQLAERIQGLSQSLTDTLTARPSRYAAAGTGGQFAGLFSVGDRKWQDDVAQLREQVAKATAEHTALLRTIANLLAAGSPSGAG